MQNSPRTHKEHLALNTWHISDFINIKFSYLYIQTMKLAFAGIFVFAFLALTASSQYVELTEAQMNANNFFLQDIRNFGVSYVIQKGVYESTKAKLPGQNYNVTDIEKTERRSTTAAAYYRFTVILAEQQNQARVRATFTIRYDHRNGAFIVSSWRYTILRSSGINGGYNAYIPIDVRPFNDGIIDELDAFNARVQEVIAEGIQEDKLPGSTYSVRFVYGGVQQSETERKQFSVKMVNPQGEYYRLKFDYYTPPAITPGEAYAYVQDNASWIRI